MNASMSYLDGNAAAGELSRIFAVDVTSAQGQCATNKRVRKHRRAESSVTRYSLKGRSKKWYRICVHIRTHEDEAWKR